MEYHSSLIQTRKIGLGVTRSDETPHDAVLLYFINKGNRTKAYRTT